MIAYTTKRELDSWYQITQNMNKLVKRVMGLNNAKVESGVIAYISKRGLSCKEPYKQTIIVYRGNRVKFQ